MAKHRFIGDRTGNADMYGNVPQGTKIDVHPSKFNPEQLAEMAANAQRAQSDADAAGRADADANAEVVGAADEAPDLRTKAEIKADDKAAAKAAAAADSRGVDTSRAR
jgi:hypothetical protein